jgi:hypothetical protein
LQRGNHIVSNDGICASFPARGYLIRHLNPYKAENSHARHDAQRTLPFAGGDEGLRIMTAHFTHAMEIAVIAIVAVSTGTALLVVQAVFGHTLSRELDQDERCRRCR